MEYPKAIMRRKELVEMGFPYELLDRAYRAPGQKFAQKINPYKKTSAVIYDTAEFEKWRSKEQEKENKALTRLGRQNIFS